jgi:hypothetical protein
MWRHPVVRGLALLLTGASIALFFLPDQLGLPLLKLPLWAQFLVAIPVVLAPLLEIAARFLPRA